MFADVKAIVWLVTHTSDLFTEFLFPVPGKTGLFVVICPTPSTLNKSLRATIGDRKTFALDFTLHYCFKSIRNRC